MGADLGPLLAAAAGATLFAQAVVRLRRRRRRDLAGWDRVALFVGAIALWVFAFSPQLDEAAERSLSGHMLQHVLIADAVPALALVAVRGPLLFFLLPAGVLRRLGRLRLLRTAGRILLEPAVAFSVWAAAIAVWHVPALYDRALASAPLHMLEHVCFVLGGVLVWAQLVDPARRHHLSQRLRLGYALLLFVSGQALANTLILYSPLYPAYAAEPHRLLGLSAVSDQQTAGLVMMAEQLATLGTFTALQLRGWLRLPFAGAAAPRHPFAA